MDSRQQLDDDDGGDDSSIWLGRWQKLRELLRTDVTWRSAAASNPVCQRVATWSSELELDG